jgi:hypothetical protein
MQIHADTCIYIHIHADSDTRAACHFTVTGTIDMGSLPKFTGAIDM